MTGKTALVAQLLQYNFQRFLPGRAEKALQAFRPYEGCDSDYAMAVEQARHHYGIFGLIAANLCLSFLGFLLMLAIDYLTLHMADSGRLALHTLAAVYCIIKFRIFADFQIRRALCLLFLLINIFLSSCCCMTYLYLVLFENIAY